MLQRRLCVWQPNNSLDFIDTWSPPTSSSSTHSPLVLEWTVWCSWTVQFFVMFDMFGVRFWAKMWCSESSMFEHSMFGVFEVWYFGVLSKTTHLFWEDWMSVEQKSLRDFDSRRTSFLIPSRDLNKRNPDWLLEPKIFLRLLYSFPLYKDNKKVEHFSPLLYITYILMCYTYSFLRIVNYF